MSKQKEEFYHEVMVRFSNQKDLEQFADLVDKPQFKVKLKKGTKTMWFSADTENNTSILDFTD